MYVGRRPDGLRPAKWITGEALLKQPPVLILIGDDDSPTILSDVILTSFDIPILSPKAISVLDKSGVNNIQYFPVLIKNWQNSEIEKSYKIANIVGLVYCLDRTNSTYNTFPEDDDISWLQQYSIFIEKILPIPPNKNKPLIFRLGEFSYHILVHETIKTAFEKEGITGSEFICPEDYV